jgi:hypothetical protein
MCVGEIISPLGFTTFWAQSAHPTEWVDPNMTPYPRPWISRNNPEYKGYESQISHSALRNRSRLSGLWILEDPYTRDRLGFNCQSQ